MVKFKTEKISDRITRIFAINSELMYLITGTNKAAIIDTGSGFGSLKNCVESLTDKPIIVLLTHGHIDHAMGAAEFNEVYMCRKDDYIYRIHSDETIRKEGIKMSQEYDKLESTDYIPSAPIDFFKEIKEGDSFDLGGITIEIYSCPGHTKGSVVMLIKEERSLLLGDACNSFTFMFENYSTSIAEYEDSLKHLKLATDGKYDKVLASHDDGNLPINIIDSMIDLCEDIKDGNVDDIPFEFKGNKGYIAKEIKTPEMVRVDGRAGNIVYNKERVY